MLFMRYDLRYAVRADLKVLVAGMVVLPTVEACTLLHSMHASHETRACIYAFKLQTHVEMKEELTK